MDAELILRERYVLTENSFAEIVVWRLPRPARKSEHGFKYRLAFIVAGECVLRYDNEAGKGDHRHVGKVETTYAFKDYETLLEDFWADIERWSSRR